MIKKKIRPCDVTKAFSKIGKTDTQGNKRRICVKLNDPKTDRNSFLRNATERIFTVTRQKEYLRSHMDKIKILAFDSTMVRRCICISIHTICYVILMNTILRVHLLSIYLMTQTRRKD